jgi:hypothetical protein
MTLYKPLAPFRVASPFIVAILVLMWLQRGRRLTFAGAGLMERGQRTQILLSPMTKGKAEHQSVQPGSPWQR